MSEQILAKDKEIVVPGELLATGMNFLPGNGTYREKDTIHAQQTGIVRIDGKVIKLIPLAGAYSPKVKDRVIGKVIDVLLSGWRIDLNSPYTAVLTMKDATSDFIKRGADLTRYYSMGDYVVCQITNVTSQKLIDVTMIGPGLRKLKGGRIMRVSPQKVPRVIGKDGSMVGMIKQATGCDISVGQNGLVWLNGEPEKEIIAVEAIKKVEREAHVPGLTDKIAAFLEKGE